MKAYKFILKVTKGQLPTIYRCSTAGSKYGCGLIPPSLPPPCGLLELSDIQTEIIYLVASSTLYYPTIISVLISPFP